MKSPRFVWIGLFGLLGVLIAGCGGTKDLPDGLYASLNTGKGEIVVRLEYKLAPMTVANFVGLAEGKLGPTPGKRYYQNMKFHRVVDGFVIQSGDPTGTGSGGPGYQFPNEISPELSHDGPGVLAMANSGPDTNGSQFYITRAATPHLDGSYSIFGRVVKGQEVVDAMKQDDALKSVTIIRVGQEAKDFIVTQQSFDSQIAASKENLVKQRAENLAKDLAAVQTRWPNATVTPSGLRYIVVEKGTGSAMPKVGTEVTCDYVGQLLDGTVFDSSVARGTPAQFTVGGVIPGWDEALVTMKKGEKRLLIIPPELGYGERGYPGVIPANAYLVFELKLISF